jgi:LCP family protein required for cell wall assembly
VEYRFGQIGDITDGTLSSSEFEQIWGSTDEWDGSRATLGDDYTLDTLPSGIATSDKVINIMLYGTDARSYEIVERSDTMILCSINTSTNTVNMFSFLRDIYVAIPRYGNHKLNTAYAVGGASLVNETININFGVEVDGSVVVDFSRFINIIDALGGVDVRLSQDEADYLNRRGLWDLDDSTAGTWNLVAGVNHLNGAQATAYCRIREVGNYDYDRTGRQRVVLSAILDQCRSMSLGQLNNLLDVLLPMIKTDMTNAQIMSYAARLLPMLSDISINSRSIPYYWDYYDYRSWDYAYIDGMSVVNIKDFDRYRKIIQDTMIVVEDETTGGTTTGDMQ